jgi:hypothetical protein
MRLSSFKPARSRATAVSTRRARASSVLVAVAVGGACLTQIVPAAAASSTVSLLGSAVPRVSSASDSASVELGVRFSSDVAGSVTGLRFFKGAGNTGTHTGSLWSTGGRRLAKATFRAESRSGWQSVTFAHPVPVAAHTGYVASYYAGHGHYAADHGYFSTERHRGVLHARATTNGLFRYGSGGGFPTRSYKATNYYVDVSFTPTARPASTTPKAPHRLPRRQLRPRPTAGS